jgi:transposase
LPDARIAVDKWHLVALANGMVTEVRQRVTREQLGRRGRKSDQLWVNRKLLLTGAEHLSAKQWRRFTTMLDRNDPTGEIGRLGRQRTPPAAARRTRAERHPTPAGRLLRSAIDAHPPEATRLANTVQTWWPAILVALTERVSNDDPVAQRDAAGVNQTLTSTVRAKMEV